MPRIRAELVAQGERVSPKRIARLMRAAGLQGVSLRQRAHTSVRHEDRRPAPGLVERDFNANVPNQL